MPTWKTSRLMRMVRSVSEGLARMSEHWVTPVQPVVNSLTHKKFLVVLATRNCLPFLKNPFLRHIQLQMASITAKKQSCFLIFKLIHGQRFECHKTQHNRPIAFVELNSCLGTAKLALTQAPPSGGARTLVTSEVAKKLRI